MPTDLPEYKGYAIVLDDDGTFRATRDKGYPRDYVAEAKTLESLKAKVNDLLKTTLGQTVWIMRESWEAEKLTFRKGTVKSVREDKKRHGADRTWSVEFPKDRAGYDSTDSVTAYRLLKDTPDNLVRFEQAKALSTEKKRIEKELEKVEESFERYTDEELLGLPPRSTKEPT